MAHLFAGEYGGVKHTPVPSFHFCWAVYVIMYVLAQQHLPNLQLPYMTF